MQGSCISSFAIILETWPARFFIAHIWERRSRNSFHADCELAQAATVLREISRNQFPQSERLRENSLCKTVVPSISSLCCSKVSSCNLIPLCGCTTQHAESTPLTSHHGHLIVTRLRGTSSKDEE